MAKNIGQVIFSITLFYLSFCAFPAYGQEGIWRVAGTVFEKGTKRPLSGISVFVEEDESIFALTGKDGRFTITLPREGRYGINAVGIGFEKPDTLKVDVGPDKPPLEIKFYLLPAMHTLREIVVVADRIPDRVGKTVISGRMLEKVPGAGGDPLRAIQSLPGVTTANDASGNPAIRGSGPQDNLYYIDFFPAGYIFHMGGLVSVFNADIVEDFNLFSSAFGPEYGDATGAVIDVKLRDPRTDRFGVKLQMSMLESDILVEGPVNEKQSFFVTARRSYIDLFLPQTGVLSDDVDYTLFPNYYDYQGKYVWELNENHRLDFEANGAGDRMGIIFKEGGDIAAHEPDIVGEFSFKLEYNSAGVILQSRISPRFSNKAAVGYIGSGFEFDTAQIGNVYVDVNVYYFRDHIIWRPNNQHQFLLGGEYGYSAVNLNLDINAAFPSDWDPDVDLTGAERKQYFGTIYGNGYVLIAKDRWKIADRVTLIFGVRGTYGDYLDEWFAEPRMGAEYDLTDTFLITAGWGKYHQNPNGLEMIEEFGNPDLNPTMAEHSVLGIQHSPSEEWVLKLEGYYKKFSELVIPDPEEKLNYINGGSGSAMGAELLFKRNETTNWSGWLSVSYSQSKRRNEYTGEDFKYQYDQPLIANLVYLYTFSSKWSFGARWRFQSGAPYTPVIGHHTVDEGTDKERERPDYGPINSGRLPDYNRLDVRIDRDWVFNTWKMGLFFEIINFYNRKNVAGYSWNADYTEREEASQLPLLPSFGLKAEF